MVFEKTLAQIVDENYVYARALHYLGVSFFEDQEKSLWQVCKEKHLQRGHVMKIFYDFDRINRLPYKELKTCPLSLLIEYLQYAHYQFIKERLPFITHIALSCECTEFHTLLPEFVEDFIKHIYEEEDSVFKYVKILGDIQRKRVVNPVKELIVFQKFSLKEEFEHHEGSDEMKAIRSLVESVVPASLNEKVLINEVKGLHRELLYHAEIENKIFFPKALKLEAEVAGLLNQISSLN